ncbi:hypothetical protein TWF694_005557 [Orbilia ellipsospora]|uniref:Thioredoxin domain-containing protein n=1 Tax=Orbilia ellipsospora TaxID=2528407 RepID=A0AAV9WTH0_9PEZI
MINEPSTAGLDLQDPTASLETYLSTPALNGAPLFILFVASKDVTTGAPWCPDVRAALPVVTEFFENHGTTLNFLKVEVGDKLAWKEKENVFRTRWGLTAIPTLGKYAMLDLGGEKVVAVGNLVENECLDVEKLTNLVEGSVYNL